MNLNPDPQAPPGFEWISYGVAIVVAVFIGSIAWWIASRILAKTPAAQGISRTKANIGGLGIAVVLGGLAGILVANVLGV